MKMHLYKMQGCGNDFLVLDQMYAHGERPMRPREVAYLCDRHFGIGADGFILLTKPETPDADAKWIFYNNNGSEAEMCGNGARCAIRYLVDRYFPGDDVIRLQTKLGIIKGRKLSEQLIEVTLTGEKDYTPEFQETILEVEAGVLQLHLINTGVPHAVLEVKDIYTYPIKRVGQQVQAHPMFKAAGTNVTFFQRTVGKRIRATTFERGVEEETMACGTGAAAAAIVFSEQYLEPLPVEVGMAGGDIIVALSPVSHVLLLQGPGEYVFEIDVEDIPHDFERVLPYEQARKKK